MPDPGIARLSLAGARAEPPQFETCGGLRARVIYPALMLGNPVRWMFLLDGCLEPRFPALKRGDDPGLVCVVEQPRDLMALEKAGTYHGTYHVLLGRLAPLQGMGPEQLTLDALEARVRVGTIREVIMATNPNLEGDGTAMLVANRLADTGVAITRLARGIASGSVLEFAN